MTEDRRTVKLRLRAPQVSWRPEAWGFLLYDRRTDQLHEGNAVGRDILRLLDRGASEEDICGEIAARYGISPRDARRDVAAFLASLDGEGLLRTSP